VYDATYRFFGQVMTAIYETLQYPFSTSPEFGTTMEVAPGVYWLRMPLPMSLNHINLYLIEGNQGWTIVDTGIPFLKTAWVANPLTR
jgi:hypothetical protein